MFGVNEMKQHSSTVFVGVVVFVVTLVLGYSLLVPAVRVSAERSAAQAAGAAEAQAQARAAAATRAQEEAQAQADAIGLLGAAGSMREAGDLGLALELGRQAVGKAPSYAEAQAFVREVEAQKKAAEEAAKVAAARHAAAAAREKSAADRETFVRRLNAAGATQSMIAGVAAGQFNEHEIRITVGDSWYYQPKQVRLQLAQGYWRLWAGIHAPSTPDMARLKLVDRMGNDLGGSSWVGSMVSVN